VTARPACGETEGNPTMQTIDVDKIWTMITEFAMDYGLRLIGAVVLLVVGRIVAGALRGGARKALKRGGTDEAVVAFAGSLAYWLVIVAVWLAVLGAFGVETASLVAVLGAVGFAVGFALQGSLSNFAAGIMLLIFRPFRIGDVVEVAGVLGSVREMALFTTIINTPDNIRIIVPNSKIFGDIIKNITAEETRRVDMVVGIGYGSDIAKAMEIIQVLLAADARVLKEPEPQIAVGELADSSVNLLVRPWSKTSDYWGVKLDFTRAVKEAFDREGIEIPFPQVTMHKG